MGNRMLNGYGATAEEIRDALAKQRPEEPLRKRDYAGERLGCPSCGRVLGYVHDSRLARCCPNCGQRIAYRDSDTWMI